MRYLLIIAVALTLSGCASIGFGPTIQLGQADLETMRKEGALAPVPANAPAFERGF